MSSDVATRLGPRGARASGKPACTRCHAGLRAAFAELASGTEGDGLTRDGFARFLRPLDLHRRGGGGFLARGVGMQIN
jgi:hypothetical protein